MRSDGLFQRKPWYTDSGRSSSSSSSSGTESIAMVRSPGILLVGVVVPISAQQA